MKTLYLIAGTESTRIEALSQLEEILGNKIIIISYATDIGIKETIRNSIVLLTSPLIVEEASPYLDDSCTIIIARRNLNFLDVEKLFSIKPQTSVLVVNDMEETAVEVVELLINAGFNEFEYTSYYPGCKLDITNFEYAITAGELELVPENIKNIINIGPRIIDITTIVEVLKELNLLDERSYLVSAEYIKKILFQEKEIHRQNQANKDMNEFLIKLINNVNDGILSFDINNNIKLINTTASTLLGIKIGDNVNKLNDLGLERIYEFLLSYYTDKIITINDSEYLFSKLFVESDGSYICTLRDIRERINLEKRVRREQQRQGHYSKYTFNNIIYTDQVMDNLIKKSKKLSLSDYSILILGQSGTGKELFAGAIHNYSKRCSGPFLGVNFSALPEDLIESELFGYEEGAFTGAKRGGKAGLFEIANGGTIFLDEIGDIPAKIQLRLLRVLQEREILKVGGNKIIPIDVRVIAATNKNLLELVKAGKFREDLYYRLKKLYINIPPLSDRKEDIIPLFSYFLASKSYKKYEILNETEKLLLSYNWPGNVRELENTVEYVLAIDEDNIISPDDLPEDIISIKCTPPLELNDIDKFILSTVNLYNIKRQSIGRKKLSELSFINNFNLSEQQIRRRLDNLFKEEYIIKNRGNSGIYLTEKGKKKI